MPTTTGPELRPMRSWKGRPYCLLDLLPVVRHGLLDGQGRMAGPLGMVLVGQRGTEEGHHPIAGELVDGALVAVDLGPSGSGSTRP